ncbi:GNAT family N-acetyltransferase [Fictibacillus enclensis]|uniref:GNAT family N-acetyltransferase n=1 Tax=Fictibacillus enclensis TaxID=1017270 RepID=UPI0025A2D8D4|nr:GNAT family N-acetyltransferase [Fictibacillus enclensis]MDM5339679.1 GNAT family N-acetyltransferase [Fictibacillus enclensis]
MFKEHFISEEHREKVELFTCSDEESVGEFLKENALKLHMCNTASTRLFFDQQDNLIGYFTLFTDQVLVPKNLKQKHNWEVFSLVGKPMYPAIRLHYMGVDENFRSKGYGKILLYFALDICKEVAENVGCNFVSIEALNSAVPFYIKHGFYKLNKNNNKFVNMIFKIDELDT